MVSNLINDNGNAAANQFVITTKTFTYFQSYNSPVARINHRSGKLTLARNWDYSNTTRKHLYIFLRDNGFNIRSRQQVLDAIESKKFALSKVNKFSL